MVDITKVPHPENLFSRKSQNTTSASVISMIVIDKIMIQSNDVNKT